MDSMGDVFANDYVRVGLPVLMGVAAASSPAGARGAGAMLSSLGALQGISESKARREESHASRTLQERRLAIAEREATEPKYEYRDGEWFALRQGQEPELIGGGDALTMVSREVRQQLGNVITGKAPLPTAAPAPQATGLPGTLDPDLERQIAAAERDVQAAVPGAVVRREGPATPTTVEPGTSMERLNALVRTPDGRAMIYLSRNPQMIKYMESMVKDERELDMAKKRAEIEYDYRMKYYNETFPRELQKSREQQAETGRAAATAAVLKQSSLRDEEMRARLHTPLREAEQLELYGKDPDKFPSQRYFDRKTGENKKGYAWKTSAEMNQLERAGEVILLSPDNAKRMRGHMEAIPIMQGIRDDIMKIYETGIFKGLKPGDRVPKAVQATWERWMQTDTPLSVAIRNIEGAKARIARIQGETGALATRDVQTALDALPTLKWVPDTIDVAYGSMNNLLRLANKQMGQLLGTKDFQHADLRELDPSVFDAPKVREDLLQQFQKTP